MRAKLSEIMGTFKVKKISRFCAVGKVQRIVKYKRYFGRASEIS